MPKPPKTPRNLAHKAKVLERTARRLPALKAVNAFMQAQSSAGLSELRAALGLTQAQAAELLHRTERNWRQFENGTRGMDPALRELFLFKALLLTQRQLGEKP